MSRRYTAVILCALMVFTLTLSGCCCMMGTDLPALLEELKPTEAQPTLPPATVPLPTEPPVQTVPPTTEAYVPYSDCGADGGYVLSESHKRYYSREELWLLTPEELTVARWEICARHGCIVSDPDLDNYFNSKDWYTPSSEYDEDDLNQTEKNNIAILNACIDKRRGITMSDDNPYKDLTGDYVIYGSDEKALTSADLNGMTEPQLKTARNEIFARHGYIFKDEALYEYFMTKDWYFPTVLSSQTDRFSLSKTEQANVNTIKAKETAFSAEKASELVTLKEQGAYKTDYTDFEYRVPQIKEFSDGAVAVQKKIDSQFNKIMKNVKQAISEGWSCDYWEFDYEAHLHKNMLFVVIWVDYLSGDGWYTVYCVDVDTGEELDRAGILDKIGVSKSKYLAAVKKAGTKAVNRLKDEGYADGEYYEFLLEQTVNSKNLEKSQLFYNSNGTAYAVMDVATIAGSGIYNAILKIDLS